MLSSCHPSSLLSPCSRLRNELTDLLLDVPQPFTFSVAWTAHLHEIDANDEARREDGREGDEAKLEMFRAIDQTSSVGYALPVNVELQF